LITEDLDINRDRARLARDLRYIRRAERNSNIINTDNNNIAQENHVIINNIIENNIIENNIMDQQINQDDNMVNPQGNQIAGNPLPVNEPTIGQLMLIIQQLQQQNDQLALRVNQIENPINPAIEPVIQTLLGVDPGTVLINAAGDRVRVDEKMFIRPPAANALSEEAKAQIKAPELKESDLHKMNPHSWVVYAALFAHYYTIGGEKPISTLWEPLVLQTFSRAAQLTVTELVDLGAQRQVYEMLKVFWRRPEDNSQDLIKGIREIELLPGEKGNMVILVNLFTAKMSTMLPAETFTKPLLDAVRNQVFIREWVADYKTKTYSSYNDFYDHLQTLAKDYDLAKQIVKPLTSNKAPPKEKEKEKNQKTKNQDRPQDRTPDQNKKKVCLLCGKDHYAFALGNDYSKAYSDQVKWECPHLGSYSEELRKKAWEDRKNQHANNKRASDKKRGGGSGGANGAASSSSA